MTITTVSKFRKNLSNYFEQAVEYKEPVIVTMNNGNAVILSEEYYRGLIATVQLSCDQKFMKQLKEAINEPLEECIDANEVNW